MKKITIYGDVHGLRRKHVNLLYENKYTLGLGDIGFDYNYLSKFDSYKHMFIKGNHDNYDQKCHLSNGDYGESILNGIKFFFIRGGFSIDWRHRILHEQITGEKSWWKEEELNSEQMRACLYMYQQIKPDCVVTHECPRSISDLYFNGNILKAYGYNPKTFTTNTSELLESCFKFHQPKIWLFGHYHKYINEYNNGTQFICLPELGYGSLYTDFSFIYHGIQND